MSPKGDLHKLLMHVEESVTTNINLVLDSPRQCIYFYTLMRVILNLLKKAVMSNTDKGHPKVHKPVRLLLVTPIRKDETYVSI